jgi:sigma-B regulation protein RsbU (phosphoserine phosphatase)
VQVLLAGFLALVVLALGLDVAVLRVREHQSDRLQDTLEPAQLELQALLTSLVDQETGERGFLLTGLDEFLRPYEQGRTATSQTLVSLRAKLTSYDDLLAAIDRLRSKIEAWQSLGADFEISAKRQGRDEVVETLVATGTGTQLFDAARVEVTDLQRGLQRTIARERHDVERLDTLLVAIDIGTLLLALALLFLTGYLARAWLTRPLRLLGTSVRTVAAGSLDSTVTSGGPPELRELAADVEAMRRRILAEVEEAERAREALADRGMIVMTLRDELAATPPDLPHGMGLAGRFSAAQGIVAGDWFDVLRLDDDRVAVALVDVSGHGAGVGAFALRTKALTVAALQSLEPGDAFEWVASRLGDTGEQFLTGVILVLNAQTGVVRYASAGHPPLLFADVRGVTELGPTGPLVGPIAGTWTTEEVVLTRGGALVVFSDGMVEARDEAGSPFGVARIIEAVEASQLGGPDAIADACIDAVQRHQASREDDLTLVVVSR